MSGDSSSRCDQGSESIRSSRSRTLPRLIAALSLLAQPGCEVIIPGLPQRVDLRSCVPLPKCVTGGG
jgi:hypothetical protein